MPRYYFHIRNGRELIQDTEGQDCLSPDKALEEAKQAARDILAERLKYNLPLGSEMYEVKDEDGNIVFAVPFLAVVRLS